jgi:hypothetical protein
VFARVTFISVVSDKFDEAIKIYQESVVPDAKLQTGFRGSYFLTDRKTGEGILMTLWANKGDAIACEDTGYYQKQLSKFTGLFNAPPARDEYYEVSSQV